VRSFTEKGGRREVDGLAAPPLAVDVGGKVPRHSAHIKGKGERERGARLAHYNNSCIIQSY